MNDRLRAIYAKLDRAEEHRMAVEEAVERFMKSNPNTLAAEMNAQRTEWTATLKVKRPTPYLIPLLIGECLQGFRGVLDHLAYALAVSNLGVPLPDDIAASSEFPIFKDICAFARWSNKKKGPAPGSGLAKIKGIAPAAQTIIESLQPYNRDNLSIDPLWNLQRLAIIDKHRLPHAVVGIAPTGELFYAADPQPIEVEWGDQPFTHDAKILTLRFAPGLPDVYVKFGGQLFLALEGWPEAEVRTGLQDIYLFIRDQVVLQLRDFVRD